MGPERHSLLSSHPSYKAKNQQISGALRCTENHWPQVEVSQRVSLYMGFVKENTVIFVYLVSSHQPVIKRAAG